MQQLYTEKEALQNRLLQLQLEKKQTDKANAAKEAQYEDFKKRLRELDRTKDNLKRETDGIDSEKERLIAVFEERCTVLEQEKKHPS